MSACAIPLSRPVPIAEVPVALRLQVVSTAGAGFPSPAQDWEETAIDLVELLRLDRAASFVFRVSGQSMIDAGIHDDDVVVVDRDAIPTSGRIVIAVVDSGISPDQRASVFEIGTRLDETKAGRGLGLAISRDLAALYGGTVELDDAPGGGLRATLKLEFSEGE